MAANHTNNRLLKQINIKPCCVRLENCNFSKIRMACSATSNEKSVELICSLKQTGIDSFAIKIHSKRFNEENMDDEFIRTSKRVKFSDCVDVQHVNSYVNNHGE